MGVSRINIVVDRELLETVRLLARARGISLSAALRQLAAKGAEYLEDEIIVLAIEERLKSKRWLGEKAFLKRVQGHINSGK